MDNILLSNDPKMQFKSLTDERFRVYEFADGSEVKITAPVALHVSASGGHRVLDNLGVSHYIPAGWIHLYWVVMDGQPHFAF